MNQHAILVAAVATFTAFGAAAQKPADEDVEYARLTCRSVSQDKLPQCIANNTNSTNTVLWQKRMGVTGPMSDPVFLRAVALGYLEGGSPEGMKWLARSDAAERDIKFAVADCRAAGHRLDTEPIYDCMMRRRAYYESQRPPEPPLPPLWKPPSRITCNTLIPGRIDCEQQ
jgi:hypothetical protein